MKKFFAVLFRFVVALLPATWLRSALTRVFPLRVINGEAGPYLYRWTVRERDVGEAHQFLGVRVPPSAGMFRSAR